MFQSGLTDVEILCGGLQREFIRQVIADITDDFSVPQIFRKRDQFFVDDIFDQSIEHIFETLYLLLGETGQFKIKTLHFLIAADEVRDRVRGSELSESDKSCNFAQNFDGRDDFRQSGVAGIRAEFSGFAGMLLHFPVEVLTGFKRKIFLSFAVIE